MIEIFKEADADIYVVPGNSDISAVVAWFCKTTQRNFIMLAGSDMDFSPKILENPDGSDNYGVNNSLLLYSIRNAVRHVVQNEQQAEMARKFGVSPVLIPNPVDLERRYPKDRALGQFCG